MSFVSECDTSALIYHFITDSLKEQKQKRSLHFNSQEPALRYWRCVSSIENRTVFSVFRCLSPPVAAKGWRQIYTEAKDWKAQLDSTSVSRKGACCLFSHAVSSLSIIPFCGLALFLLFVLPACSWNKSFITSVCLSVCGFNGCLREAGEIELGQDSHLFHIEEGQWDWRRDIDGERRRMVQMHKCWAVYLFPR